MVIFPYENVRSEQQKVVVDISKALENKKHAFIHAPTGLGKTAASISPCLDYAIKNNKTVFFLTSRHTQHLIALETVKLLKQKYFDSENKRIFVSDLVGKKWMCAFDHLKNLSSSDFRQHCIKLREKQLCQYYLKTKINNQLTTEAKLCLAEANMKTPSSEQLVVIGKEHGCCPYEIGMEMAKAANIIIGDYYHIFNKRVQTMFFNKLNKSLEDCIIIVDEAHNLPERLRKLGSSTLTSTIISNAIKEANKFKFEETLQHLIKIQDILIELATSDERVIKKDDFVNRINNYKPYMEIKEDLISIGENVLEKQERSSILAIGKFLTSWNINDEGVTRIISKQENPISTRITLSVLCLDPCVLSNDIISQVHSCIFMSATLQPLEMYKDILGAENAILESYESPFPEENKSTMVIPLTTTKYSMRNEKQFQAIARICCDVCDVIPGNVLLFFPSYKLQRDIGFFIEKLTSKNVMYESGEMTKDQKAQLLDNFKANKEKGSLMLAVTSGSFGEGVDLPGDLLNGVIVVGLPLTRQDLATRELIEYYNKKFGRGWEYGYAYPAFQKCLQNAGRCIRTEKDRGVIIFLDERYLWPMYKRCFPRDMEIKVTKYPVEEVEEFFG